MKPSGSREPTQRTKVADFGGHPILGTDAVGANTYASVVTAPKQCRYLHATCITNSAIVSIDGGSTDSLVVVAGTERLFVGLDIPAGANIQGKNETAGDNYADLHVSVW